MRKNDPVRTYTRKVSGEEAREGYLLVEKTKLGLFPREGERFSLEGHDAVVESYACTCRGPDRPHRHWLVRLGGLMAGETVEVVAGDDGRYSLRRR
jgi:hypothetical protein